MLNFVKIFFSKKMAERVERSQAKRQETVSLVAHSSRYFRQLPNKITLKVSPSSLLSFFKVHGPFLALISAFGFVAQFGVLYQAMCMQELIAQTTNLAELNQNLTMKNSTAVDQAIEVEVQYAKNDIYLRCFLMVLGQFVYTNVSKSI